jgi:murein DD-endopeptidase MepM/ murein hydrolase activator NlpD
MKVTIMCRKIAIAVLVPISSQLACRDSSGPREPTIADYILGVRVATGGGVAVLRSGAAPQGGSGPTITAIPLGAFILGGTAPVQITGNAQFSAVVVSVDGVNGYWELSLPASTRASLFVTLSQDLPNQNFGISYAAAAAGSMGAYTKMPVSVTTVGTGDIQVSISWDVPSDLDLHVVDPSGEHIYFGHKSSASNGELDLDSNPACDIDRINNENITWPLNKAPTGHYAVYVNLYASCGTNVTTYAVTVAQRGSAPQVFFGTVSAATPASQGVLVTTFTHTGLTAAPDRFTWPIDPNNSSNGFYAACADNPQCFWISTNGWRDVQPFLRYKLIDANGRVFGYHLGADWNLGSGDADKGLPVYSTADGTVVSVQPAVAGWGNIIFVKHVTTFGVFTSMYAHVDWMLSGPPPLGSVTRGQQLARVGNGGGLYPYHLHFEIRRGTSTAAGPGYVPTPTTAPPQDQVDPNAFIAAYR